MRKFLLLVFAFLLLPLNVLAEDTSYISCDKDKYKNGDEIKCDIYVDVDFVVTSVSGKVVLDKNLELVSSSYNSSDWLMLDDEFSVKSINLISENIEKRDKFVIASFVVKAINKKDVSDVKISFQDIKLGDDGYNENKMIDSDVFIDLNYKSNNNIFLIISFLSLIVVFLAKIKNDKEKEEVNGVRDMKKVSKKKIKSIIIVLILLLIPSYVKAANDININCTKVKLSKNEEVSCTLAVSNLNFVPTNVSGNVKVGNYLNITSSSYDKDIWTSFDTTFDVKDINLIRQSKDKVSSIVVATFKVKASSSASGSSTISFNDVVMGDNNYNSVTLGGKSVDISFKSSEKSLKSLSVEGETLEFSKDKISYSLTVDKDSITINATAVDSNSKVSGTGKKTLKYGENTFNVVVTAEDGSKKTYTLKVTRKDNRSTNNYLSSLSLSSGDLNFDKNINSYDVLVDGSISNLEILASLEDSKAKFVSGFGPRNIKLEYGNNIVLVKVLSENEKEKVYTLNITRKDDRSSDSSLKNITISSGKIDFRNDKYEYDVFVSNDVESVVIKADANDPKSKVEISGNDTLEVGNNLYTIKVTSEVGEVSEYTINVIREEKVTITNSNKIKNIEIKNHDFDFSSDKYEYILKSNESKLDIVVTLFDENATYEIKGNENLEEGSIISITVTDSDNNHSIYKIHIENYNEVNVLLIFFIISIILNIILIVGIVYFVLKDKKKDVKEKKAN